jgi:hypothetical protein
LIRRSFILPAAIDIVETRLSESYAKELRKIPLLDNMRRRILDTSQYLCGPTIDKLKTPSFALQIGKATDVVKDEHLITFVQYVLENDIKEDILFLKPVDGRARNVSDGLQILLQALISVDNYVKTVH